MRTIIFCGTMVEAGIIHEAAPGSILMISPMHELLEQFKERENVLLITTSCMSTGWIAPKGTRVVFTDTFPEGAHKIQARARPADKRIKG